MFSGAGLSTENYDNLLMGWSQQELQPNVDFHAGNSRYSFSDPAVARQSIIDTFNWTITDGGATPFAITATELSDNEVLLEWGLDPSSRTPEQYPFDTAGMNQYTIRKYWQKYCSNTVQEPIITDRWPEWYLEFELTDCNLSIIDTFCWYNSREQLYRSQLGNCRLGDL